MPSGKLVEVECPQVVYTALFASSVLLVGTIFALGYASVALTDTLDAVALYANATS